MIKYSLNQAFKHTTMNGFTHKIVDSILKIDKADWDSLFGETLQGYEFYRAVEESKLEGFSFHYILIYENGRPALIAPAFIADFYLDIASGGTLKKITGIIRRVIPRFFILKTLFYGSPISENGALGLSAASLNKNALLRELIKITENFCKNNRIRLTIFKDFLKEDANLLATLKTMGFFMAESFPAVVNELNFCSLEEYFATLNRNTRKDVRRKIKKAKSSNNILVKVAGNVEDIIEEVYSLYLNTYNSGDVRFEKLTKEFFINVGRLIPQTRFFLYYADARLAAFNLCFASKERLIDEFIGFDYALAYKYNLYFFSWCYNIEWCLKNSIKYYQTGQTDYYPKLKLGGRTIPLYAFLRHSNAALNSILRVFAKLLTPVNLDKNLKELKTDV